MIGIFAEDLINLPRRIIIGLKNPFILYMM